MKTITVTIEGITPLLMNRFTEEASIQIDNGGSNVFRGDKEGTPREQAEMTAYRDTDGMLYIPGPNMFAALVEAGKFQKAGKSKLTTLKTSLVPGAVGLVEILLPLGTKEFEVDSRAIVNPATGGRRTKHRAKLNEWAVSFTLEVDDETLSAKQVRQLVDDAGKRCGVGDYRPSRKGPFGRFKVVRWEVDAAAEAAE